jgi:hypothetical protein
MFVSRKVITSKAFLSLATATACQVYFIFLSKCRWEKVQTRPGSRDKAWVITNNKEIQFSYREALEKYGMKDGRFRKAIDELLRVGLIDIAHSGFGLHKDRTLYAISDRWEKFGTAEFQRVERPKRRERIGFQKGNRHGRHSRQKKNSTVADNCCSTVVEDCCV